jgi:hypothetical protein
VRNNPSPTRPWRNYPDRAPSLAEAGKANLNHFQRFTGLKEVSFLIPDSCLDEETTEAFDSAGLEVART